MNSIQNLITFPKDLPINIQIYKNDIPTVHWHPSTELLFVLSGSASIVIDDKKYTAKNEDIVLINPDANHVIYGDQYEILSLSIQLNHLKFNQQDDSYFDLNSCDDTYNSRYNYTRQLVAHLVKVSSSGENRYMTLSLLYALVSHFMDNFLTNAPLRFNNPEKKNRIQEIICYVDEHYKENIQLSNMADYFSITPSYLSTFFKKETGTTFLQYYNERRLTSAVNEMLTTNDPLEQIALGNGFSDYRSFTKAFKEKYHMLPSQYRRTSQHDASDSSIQSIQDDSKSFDSLSKYLSPLQATNNFGLSQQIRYNNLHFDSGTVDFSQDGLPLSHKFKTMCTVGSAKQFLYSEVQEMVRRSQSEIGFSYVKFHGILSDEMMVYTEDKTGNPSYSFTLVDKVIDFLLSVGLKPFMQISFMPIALAADPKKMIDMWHFNTSPPKDLIKWIDLVEAFVIHLVVEYGINKVTSWLFCVWNEPDGSTESFGWESQNEFFDFYRATYKAVKKICPDVKFGTPSLLLQPNSDQRWALDLFHYGLANDCSADFLNIHYYDNDFSSQHANFFESFTLDNLAKPCPMNEDPFAFNKFINAIKQDQRQLDIDDFPIYLTEWNLTVSQRDLINDTCFKSCYLAKNLLENYDRLESYGYWVLTDFIEEMPIPKDLFHGGLGLFTYNGIPKAHYNVFKLISQLQDTLIAKGNGYFITKSNKKISAIVYNYEHFSKLFATGILFDVSTDNRYAAFSEKKQAKFHLNFNNLPYKGAVVKDHIISQDAGSSYDAWVRIGARPSLRKEDITTLRQLSYPGIELGYHTIEDGILELSRTLAPLEVRLIEIDLV